VPTCDISPYDGLEGYDFGLLDEDAPALQLLLVLANFLRHLLDPRGYDVIRDDVFKLVEPEE
jgi:hypothetical protein